MNDIAKMNDKDLASFISKKREEVRADRFSVGTRDVRAVRTAKKEIARARTEQTKRHAALRNPNSK
jgi:ribosomal protein L29